MNQCLKLLKPPTASNLVDMGRGAAHTEPIGKVTPGLITDLGQEATGNACGVPVAMLQGKSWAPILLTGAW